MVALTDSQTEYKMAIGEILLGALAEAIFGVLIEDLAQRPTLAAFRERLRADSMEIPALQQALTSAYNAFSKKCPDLAASFFDKHFLLKSEVAVELAKALTPNQFPDASVLEKLWRGQFEHEPDVDISQPLAYFLDEFQEQVKSQPALKPFVDSRALDRTAEASESQVYLETQMLDRLDKISKQISGQEAPAPKPHRVMGPIEWLTTSSRLIRPRIANYLHRARLTNRLAGALVERTAFLHADAGYGKTWLVQDYVETYAPAVVWYTFTESVVSATQFIGELASELIRQTNVAGMKTALYLRDRGSNSRRDEALAVLIDELEGLQDVHLLVVLEDLHHISHNTPVESVIEALVRLRPPNLQLILTSRHPLPFGQARLVSQGQFTAIHSSEIAFDLSETQSYLTETLELNLSEEQTRYIHERTGGWVAAISLAAEALQAASASDVDELIQRLTGFEGNIYDFFAEEVYESLNADVKWLLKRIGLARTVQPVIVDLFTTSADGGQVLRDLARRNTFLVQDASDAGSYRFHSLFSEFLETRFRDEEGDGAVRSAHSRLAHFYAEDDKWYLAAEHAIDAEEYQLAVRGLEAVAPAGANLGYGPLVLSMLKQVPSEWLERSALLLETAGRAALQVSDLNLALESFNKAEELYQDVRNEEALNRLQFLIAEARFARGDIEPEAFIEIAHQVAQKCYEQSDVHLGTQVELRLIAVGQTILARHEGPVDRLIEQSDRLVTRLSQLGEEYALVKAKALAAQAHLLFQVHTFASHRVTSTILMRSTMGHPVPAEERITLARTFVEDWQRIQSLYAEAERITKEENKIEWAIIRLQRVTDNVHQLSHSLLITKTVPQPLEGFSVDGFAIAQCKDALRSFLRMLQVCAGIFAEYRMVDELAITYCEAAQIHDALGDRENRNRLAQQALDLTNEKGLLDTSKRARKILENRFTFSSVVEGAQQELDDRNLASMDEEKRALFLELVLGAFAGDADTENIRRSIESDIDDMIAAAKQRVEWCRHVQIIQDLEHTQSLETMYRTIPEKWVICTKLGHQSPSPGYSFDELWPMFKGVFCLGCLGRSLAK